MVIAIDINAILLTLTNITYRNLNNKTKLLIQITSYIALYNQAMSLLKIPTKKFEAKKIFELIYEEHNSDFAPAYYGLGLYYVALNEKKFALDYFNKSIILDPEFIDAYLRKGNCCYRLKRYTESIDCFDFVISKKITIFASNYNDP